MKQCFTPANLQPMMLNQKASVALKRRSLLQTEGEQKDHLSKMSEITHAYISRPSGNCSATLAAPACLILHIVL